MPVSHLPFGVTCRIIALGCLHDVLTIGFFHNVAIGLLFFLPTTLQKFVICCSCRDEIDSCIWKMNVLTTSLLIFVGMTFGCIYLECIYSKWMREKMSKKSCVTLLTHAILIEFLTKVSSSVSSLSYWNKSNSNPPHLAEKLHSVISFWLTIIGGIHYSSYQGFLKDLPVYWSLSCLLFKYWWDTCIT